MTDIIGAIGAVIKIIVDFCAPFVGILKTLIDLLIKLIKYLIWEIDVLFTIFQKWIEKKKGYNIPDVPTDTPKEKQNEHKTEIHGTRAEVAEVLPTENNAQ